MTTHKRLTEVPRTRGCTNRDHQRQPDRDLFFEYHLPQNIVPPSLPIAMRRGKWKLFSNFEFDRYELYDLENDISEQQDVAATQAQVVRDMGARLRAWWGQFADKVDVKAERTRVPTPTPEELEQRYYKN